MMKSHSHRSLPRLISVIGFAGALVPAVVALEGCATDTASAPSAATLPSTGSASPYDAARALTTPLAQVPSDLLARVQEHVAVRGAATGNPNLWSRAVIAGALPVYRPDIEGPAYFELKIVVDGSPAGFVLASTGAHDAPIVAWRTTGPTLAEAIDAETIGEATRFVRVNAFTLAAEDSHHELVSVHNDGAVAGLAIRRESWGAIKNSFTSSQVTRLAALRRNVAPLWTAEASMAQTRTSPSIAADGTMTPMMKPVGGGGGGDGPPITPPRVPVCTYTWALADSPSDSHPPTPRWNQYVAQFGTETRASGCTPTAYAIFLGWLSEQHGHATGEWAKAGLENAYTDVVTKQVWNPPPPRPSAGLCQRVPTAPGCDGEIVPGHWATVTSLVPAVAPYLFQDIDVAGNSRIDAIVRDIGSVLGTKGQGDGGGWTSSSDNPKFQDYLNSNGIPLVMAFNDSHDQSSKFGAIATAISVDHAPVVINIPKHTALIDAEEACSGDWVTNIYERVNEGHGGKDDVWLVRTGSLYDDVDTVSFFTPR